MRQSAIGTGERLSYNGRGALGFAIGAGNEVWTGMTPDQQNWVVGTLTTLNNKIYQATGTTCPTWGPSITAAGGCFQAWFNANRTGFTRPDGSLLVLRTDGVFDQDSLDALRTLAALDPGTFPKPFPGTTLPGPAAEEKKLSKGAIAGLAAGGATVLGGLVYLATRKKTARRRR